MDNRRSTIGTALLVLGVLLLLTILVMICRANPGGGAALTMAVYTRSSRAKLVRRRRGPGCCLVLVAASATQVLCILGKLIGAITMPWLGVLLPLLVALVLVLMFAPVRRD